MRVLEKLEPANVFSYFEDICQIPHGSGNTKQIGDYLIRFAKAHKLKCRRDESGNVIMWKKGSPGYEKAPAVMLQGHIDMVAVKDADCDLNLKTDGLRLAITKDGEWVYAKGTSLGGDDGIAVAYALAILADDSLKHPPLEVVLTVDEEIGLLGAAALDTGDLKSKYLLNMDSEDDGIFLTSCAGGATFECRMPVSVQTVEGVVYEWSVKGLKGGHSGSDIHLGRANANLIFGRFLSEVSEKVTFWTGDFAGGEKDNAIPNLCRALFVTAPEDAVRFEDAAASFAKILKEEYKTVEPDMVFSLSKRSETMAAVLNEYDKQRLISLLEHMPSGIQRMMPDIPGMVQTSLNMGILRLRKREISMTFSVRSASGTEKTWLMKRMKDLTRLIGGKYEITGTYSAWEYNPDSKLQGIMSQAYEELTGQKPQLTGIHAGVECGIFTEKMPGIDCISYGPQMMDIHTAREKLNIPSVRKNYELTLKVLEKLKG